MSRAQLPYLAKANVRHFFLTALFFNTNFGDGGVSQRQSQKQVKSTRGGGGWQE
jgi:hypothetical protein